MVGDLAVVPGRHNLFDVWKEFMQRRPTMPAAAAICDMLMPKSPRLRTSSPAAARMASPKNLRQPDRRWPPATFWFLTESSFDQHCMGLHRFEGERLPLFNLARPDLGDWKGGRDDAKVGSGVTGLDSAAVAGIGSSRCGERHGEQRRWRAELETTAPSWSHVSRPR